MKLYENFCIDFHDLHRFDMFHITPSQNRISRPVVHKISKWQYSFLSLSHFLSFWGKNANLSYIDNFSPNFWQKINQSEAFSSLIGQFLVTKWKIECHFSHIILWQFYFSLSTMRSPPPPDNIFFPNRTWKNSNEGIICGKREEKLKKYVGNMKKHVKDVEMCWKYA